MDQPFGPQKKTHFGFHAIMGLMSFVTGLVLFIVSVKDYNTLDTVSLYTMNKVIPGANFADNLANLGSRTIPNDYIRLEGKLLDTCYMPDLYDLLYHTGPGNTNTDVSVYWKTPVDVERVQINTATSMLDIVIPGWGKQGAMTDAYLNASNPNAGLYNMQALPPICRCFHGVIQKYKNTPTMMYGQMLPAIKACIVTQTAIPTVQLLSKIDLKVENNMEKRKYISRCGVLLILCTSYLIDILLAFSYKDFTKIDPADKEKKRRIQNNMQILRAILIFILSILMWLIPLAMGGKGGSEALTSNIIACTSLLILPPLFTHMGMMWLEFNVLNEMERRKARRFIHPFTFTVMLTALSTIAFLENGVFIFDHVVVRSLHNVAIGLMYEAVLIFSVMDVKETPVNLSTENRGAIAFMVTSIFMIGAYLVPFFPTKCDLNLLWVMPMVLTVVTFLTVALNSAYTARDEWADMLPFFQKITLAAIMLYVLLYFLMDRVYIELGQEHFVNAGRKTMNWNFALSVTPQDPYWYVVP